ncbi:MAG: hypothetical protein KAX31_06980, partial [Thermoplasmata archaeon]|nr:hypothetical protein [Thermoplasmata archaeon]
MIKLGGGDRGQLDTVAEKLRKATKEADRLAEKLSSVKQEVIELENMVKGAGVTDSSSSTDLDTLEEKRVEYRKSLSRCNDTIKGMRKELEKTGTARSDIEEQLATTGEQLDTLDSQRQKKEKELLSLASKGLGKEIKGIQTKIERFTKEEAGLAGHLGTLDSKMKMLEDRLKEVDEAIKEIDSRVKAEENNIKVKSKALGDHGSKLKAMEKIEDSMGKELADIRMKRDEAYKAKTGVEADIDKLAHSVETKNDFIRGMRIELENATKKLAEAEEAVKALKLGDMKKLPSTETLDKIIRSAEAAITGLGNVNMLALDHYDEQKERHNELGEELKRLRDQRKRLMKLVEELNEKKKIGLLKVFEAVNEKFRDVYAELS